MEDLLLLHGVRDLGCLTREVKVFADLASAKGVIVEGVSSLVELIAQAIVGVFEVDSEMSGESREEVRTTYTSSSPPSPRL